MKYSHFNDKNGICKLSEADALLKYDPLKETHFIAAVKEILRECHINCHYKGYDILIDAARIIYLSSFEHLLITKEIYDVLAVIYKTNSSQIEHAMRTAITCGWEKYQEANKNKNKNRNGKKNKNGTVNRTKKNESANLIMLRMKNNNREVFSIFDKRPSNNLFINYISRLAIGRTRLV